MSSVTPLAAALIGAGGAVFGGVLTTSGQLIIERSRARRDREANRAREARELRLAVRLVVEELAEARSLIESAAKARRYWVAPRELPTTTWNEYRTDIASAIESSIDWRHVTSAYDAINNLNWTVAHRRNTDQSVDTPASGARVSHDDNTRAVWRMIRRAIESLEKVTGVAGAASRLADEPKDPERAHWPYGDGADFDEETASSDAQQEVWEEAQRAVED